MVNIGIFEIMPNSPKKRGEQQSLPKERGFVIGVADPTGQFSENSRRWSEEVVAAVYNSYRNINLAKYRRISHWYHPQRAYQAVEPTWTPLKVTDAVGITRTSPSGSVKRIGSSEP